MPTLAIWFEDTEKNPERSFRAGRCVSGMPECQFDLVPGVGTVLERRYVGPGTLEGVLIELADAWDAEWVQEAVHEAAKAAGTIAWIRSYDEPAYRKAWDARLPLFSE